MATVGAPVGAQAPQSPPQSPSRVKEDARSSADPSQAHIVQDGCCTAWANDAEDNKKSACCGVLHHYSKFSI